MIKFWLSFKYVYRSKCDSHVGPCQNSVIQRGSQADHTSCNNNDQDDLCPFSRCCNTSSLNVITSAITIRAILVEIVMMIMIYFGMIWIFHRESVWFSTTSTHSHSNILRRRIVPWNQHVVLLRKTIKIIQSLISFIIHWLAQPVIDELHILLQHFACTYTNTHFLIT